MIHPGVHCGVSGQPTGSILETLLSSLFIAAVGQNLALDGLLGLCPMVATSRRFEVASGMALMTVVLLPPLCIAAFLVDRWLLVPLDAAPLALLIWVLLSFLVVSAAGAAIRRWMPVPGPLLLPYLPFFGVNCLVLGAVLTALAAADGVTTILGWSLGTAIGYAAVLLTVTGLRERLSMTALPRAMHGAPALVLSMALLALALSGLRGIG